MDNKLLAVLIVGSVALNLFCFYAGYSLGREHQFTEGFNNVRMESYPAGAMIGERSGNMENGIGNGATK